MHKILKLSGAIFFSLSFLIAPAQQKYALLVGINKYYNAPGQIYSQLNGCDNDATAMKYLLINRFGFKAEGINTLFDADATKQSIILSLMKILGKCKAGDNVVFYFSGHGVWMYSNGAEKTFDGAMVMSDLYADNQDFLLNNNEMTSIFNMFVEKKVTLTSFFDCCYSGNILAGMSFDMAAPIYNTPQPAFKEKAIDLDDIQSAVAGSATKMDSSTLLQVSSYRDLTKTYQDSASSLLRSYNLSSTLTDNTSTVTANARPDDRFLSFSGCSDYEKGLEVVDETGTYHGVFTKALLRVMSQHAATTPVKDIISALYKMIGNEFYSQSPLFRCDKIDSVRYRMNLFGVPNEDCSDNIATTCGSPAGEFVPIYSGTDEGLAKGNLLSLRSNDNCVVQITTIENDWSVGKIIKGTSSMITSGATLLVKDHYTLSSPLVKLYIPTSDLTRSQFVLFFNKTILPLTRLPSYSDYDHWDSRAQIKNLFFNGPHSTAVKTAHQLLADSSTQPFFAYLPIPSYLVQGLKDSLRKDQNVELVSSASQADYSLYLIYSPDSVVIPNVYPTKKTGPSFVFTYYNYNGSDPHISAPVYRTVGSAQTVYYFGFNTWNVRAPDVNITGKDLDLLSNNLYQMTKPVIRSISAHWMNEYPLRIMKR